MTEGPPERRKRLSPQARREVIERAATEVFAEHGYHGASVDEIARRSGISIPVLYDHFASKQALHRQLLERHFADLRAIWQEHLVNDRPVEQRIAETVDAWFGYVEANPYAWRMLFHDTTGQTEIEAVRREIAEGSRALILPMFAGEPDTDLGDEDLNMRWEAWRGAIQGLALWWGEHPHIPRRRVVATAMDMLWIGVERVRNGERWVTG